MNFEYSEEQKLFQDSITRYLSENYMFEQRQNIVKSSELYSKEVWAEAADLGWLSLLFPEDVGGFDGGPIEIMLMFERFGRHLVIEPFLETLVLFGGVLRRVNTPEAKSLIARIMTGDLQGTLAHFEGGRRGSTDSIHTKAITTEDGYELCGTKTVVYNAGSAEYFIVSAMIEESEALGLFLVSKQSIAENINSYKTVDGRDAAEISLTNLKLLKDALLSSGSESVSILMAVFDDAHIAMTAEAVGAMDVLLNSTIEYTKQRKQFGVPISKFQVLQHRMANMFMAQELAKSLMYAAAIKLRDGHSEARAFVSGAKAKADKSAQYVAHSAIQLHGGIATTDELNIGHYLKKITIASQLFGSTKFHISRFRELT